MDSIKEMGRESGVKALQGLKLFRPISDLLAHLRDQSCANPNRVLHYDNYATLIILYFLNPGLDSLRALQATASTKAFRRKFGISGAALGSLSAAQHVFDPDLLAELIPPLVDQLGTVKADARLSELDKTLTAVDGTLLRALPRIAWAHWQSDGQRAAKAHVRFEILKGVAYEAEVTDANTSESHVFEGSVASARFYVLDRGYAKYGLFQSISDAGSNFVCRVRENAAMEVIEERPLTDADRAARVVRDVVVKLGGSGASKVLPQVRIVEIAKKEEPSRRRRFERRRDGEESNRILLVTDRLDLPAELIAVIYAERWKIEIFFRWLKCMLGCKHLIAESRRGVQIQIYCALLTCLLISIWTGRKPNKRVFEAICLYLQGWFDLDDVLDAIKRLERHELKARPG